MLSVLPEDPTYALFYTCDWINPAAVKSGHMHNESAGFFAGQHVDGQGLEAHLCSSKSFWYTDPRGYRSSK